MKCATLAQSYVMVWGLLKIIAPELTWHLKCLRIMYGSSCASLEVFLNPFAKGLAKNLPITVCDGIINL